MSKTIQKSYLQWSLTVLSFTLTMMADFPINYMEYSARVSTLSYGCSKEVITENVGQYLEQYLE